MKLVAPKITSQTAKVYTLSRSAVDAHRRHPPGKVLTGFCISQLWSYITWLLVYAVTWAYMKVPTKDLQVVYLQFVFPHIGQY